MLCSVTLGLGPANPVAYPPLLASWVLISRQWWENGMQEEDRSDFLPFSSSCQCPSSNRGPRGSTFQIPLVALAPAMVSPQECQH